MLLNRRMRQRSARTPAPAMVPLFRGMTYMDPAAPCFPHDADILTRQQGAPKANSRRDDGGTFMKSGGRIGEDSRGNWIHFLFLLSSASRNILHEEKMMKNTCPCGERFVGNFIVIKRPIDVKLICGDHSVKKTLPLREQGRPVRRCNTCPVPCPLPTRCSRATLDCCTRTHTAPALRYETRDTRARPPP